VTTKIKLTPNFMAIVTAHGKTKAYLHRFKIIVSRMTLWRREPNCGPPLYDCTKLQREREKNV